MQVANLVQLVSSLGLSFAAPLGSNSVLFSSFQPFLIIIRALNNNHMLYVSYDVLFLEHFTLLCRIIVLVNHKIILSGTDPKDVNAC